MNIKSPFLLFIYEHMHTLRYAKRTIESYLYWIRFFIKYNKNQHPNVLSEHDVESFLSYLANQRQVAASTQTIALNALVFLYKEIIKRPLKLTLNFHRSAKTTKLPEVLTPQQVSMLLNQLANPQKLLASIMYGSGLRLMEAIRLRIQDINFDYQCIEVWNTKGFKNRRVTLATELNQELVKQMNIAKAFYLQDIYPSDLKMRDFSKR
ncbi:phage integrase N-terminal SAM-like domain-containing protein [Catenovulum maritimum]|uniref:phage integrase N-terminal SAM-like domain-containing protein n=1 Tax=Catenovulum maritimum TaxID=1513271 RepID=UPI00069E9761|nr:phage integrase N-terminal SAM-like domain-containing protein [Catenovulum maritimum]